MPVQPHLFPEASDGSPAAQGYSAATPIWLQRISLFILVIFCLYLGVIMAALPWWPKVWDRNPMFLAHPALLAFVQLGPVRGIVSGFGLIDIWIGISEAIHYREDAVSYTAPRI